MGGNAIESGRAVIRCRYYGPTDHRGSRIRVSRFDSWNGADPNRMTVSWDHALNPIENYVAAVQKYIDRADWSGTWVVSTIPDGAVAMWVPYTTSRSLATLAESHELLDELEMTHLLTTKGA